MFWKMPVVRHKSGWDCTPQGRQLHLDVSERVQHRNVMAIGLSILCGSRGRQIDLNYHSEDEWVAADVCSGEGPREFSWLNDRSDQSPTGS
jgi:hypothetical protein